MTCYHPMHGYRSTETTKNGKRKITFDRRNGFVDLPVTVPCGQCRGCRLERSRQWAIRCMHEASLHEDNCFLTLTYNDDSLPMLAGEPVLVLDDFQRFMKRFRKRCGKLRFYHCGEYGEKYGRPHYHACIFGYDFPDKKLHTMSNGIPLFTSEILSELWPHGYATIGSVTFDSAAYVARYIMKKQTGENAFDHYYIDTDQDTGEIHMKPSEYTTMSRRPGIGHDWLKKFMSDVYPRDHVIVDAKPVRPPKYYDGLYELQNPINFERIKHNRRVNAKKFEDNNTPERLAIREQVLEARISRLVRNLE